MSGKTLARGIFFLLIVKKMVYNTKYIDKNFFQEKDMDSEFTEDSCCNVVIWDIFLAMITSGFACAKFLDFHWAICILIGFIAGIVVGILMMVKILGTIIQFAFSIIWGAGLIELLNEIFEIYKYIPKDSTKMWAIRVGVILLFFGGHILFNSIMYSSAFGFIGNELFDNVTDKFTEKNCNRKIEKKKRGSRKRGAYYDKLEMEVFGMDVHKTQLMNIIVRMKNLINVIGQEEFEKLIDIYDATANCYNSIIDVKKRYSSRPKEKCKHIAAVILDVRSKRLQIQKNIEYMEKIIAVYEEQKEYNFQKENNTYQEKKESMERQDENNSLFAGCNDIESIRKRYRELMKIFHPDNSNGDNEMCQEIQSSYEQLCKKYKENS